MLKVGQILGLVLALGGSLAVCHQSPPSNALEDRIVLYPSLIHPGLQQQQQQDQGQRRNGGGNDRIVGGVEATPHEFPFVVALTVDDRYFCGGSIISPDVVLTAAHCMDEASRVEVEAGGHSLSTNEDSKQIRNSLDFVVHERWSTLTNANDIALIFMSPPLNLTEYVNPIPLASVEPAVNAPVTAIGWGLTHDDPFATVSDKLFKVTTPVEHDQVAADFYGDFIDWDTKISTDSTGGMGTCNGDSGGPLFNSATELVGSTSFGAAVGCSKGHPDVFTSIPMYLDWIEEQTGITADMEWGEL